MKNKPLISVIMPVHNAGPFVAEAIESVLGQTLKDFELIIIDDLSTDNSLNIIKRYMRFDKRIRLLHNNKNIQIAASLNRGIKNARCEYIARMDADDIAAPDRFALQYQKLNKHKHVAIVGSDMHIVDYQGKIFSKRQYPAISKELKRLMFRYSPFAHPVVMFRKSAVVKFGGYDESKVPCEDIDLWFKLGSQYEFASIPRFLLKYRILPTSNSNRGLLHLEMLGFSIKLNAIRRYGYRPGVYDVLYNIIEFISLWFMPAGIRVRFYNMLRGEGLI